MEINFIDDLYSEGGSFILWQEIFKATLAGGFAFLVTYFSVIKTYRNDKKKERERNELNEKQSFEYIRVITQRSYKDIYTQLKYFFEYINDILTQPSDRTFPKFDARNYLGIFVKQIDKKEYYFLMQNRGGIVEDDLIKMQSILFYFHDVFELIYGHATKINLQYDYERRMQYNTINKELNELLISERDHPNNATDQLLAQALAAMTFAYAQQHLQSLPTLHERTINLLPQLQNQANNMAGSARLKTRLNLLFQQLINLDNEIIFQNQKHAETLKRDYRRHFLTGLVELRTNCRKINGFVFPELPK